MKDSGRRAGNCPGSRLEYSASMFRFRHSRPISTALARRTSDWRGDAGGGGGAHPATITQNNETCPMNRLDMGENYLYRRSCRVSGREGLMGEVVELRRIVSTDRDGGLKRSEHSAPGIHLHAPPKIEPGDFLRVMHELAARLGPARKPQVG